MNVGKSTQAGRGCLGVPWLSARQVALFLGAAGVTAAAAALSSAVGSPSANAAPCPNVEVVFARGTMEPPGVGETGQGFVDALNARLGTPVGVYPVNYPASLDFPTAVDGVIDEGNHVASMAANCPNTKMVLGGYSQGAAVTGYVTSDRIPDGYTPPEAITGPMAPGVASHVAAVALFGTPSNDFLARYDAPQINVGQAYAGKTVQLCEPGDPICSPDGTDNGAHTLYAVDGMEGQAADFVTRRLGQNWDYTDQLP